MHERALEALVAIEGGQEGNMVRLRGADLGVAVSKVNDKAH